MKDSFLIFTEHSEMLEDLEDSQAGIVFKNILRYQLNQDLIDMDQASKIAFKAIKAQVDRSNIQYDEMVEKRRAAGKKGGLAKANNAKQGLAKDSKAYLPDPHPDPHPLPDIERDKRAEQGPAPPSLKEIEDYVTENRLNVDAKSFFDYYEGTKWHAGRSKVTDWKSKIKEWDRDHKRNIRLGIPPKFGRNVDYNEVAENIMMNQSLIAAT